MGAKTEPKLIFPVCFYGISEGNLLHTPVLMHHGRVGADGGAAHAGRCGLDLEGSLIACLGGLSVGFCSFFAGVVAALE